MVFHLYKQVVTSAFFVQDTLFFKQKWVKYVISKGTYRQSHPDDTRFISDK